MTIRLTNLAACVVCVAMLYVASGARAAPIVYSFISGGSGELGNDTFTNAGITFELNGDTDDVVGQLFPVETEFVTVFLVPVLSGTVTIGGLGTFDLLDDLAVFATPSFSAIGLNGPDGDIIAIQSSPLNYDLRTDFGPAGDAFPFFDDTIATSTSGGELILTNLSTTLFLAELSETEVPEPASAALLCTGLFALGYGRRRWRQAA